MALRDDTRAFTFRWLVVLSCAALLAGCSTSGSLTIFPSGDFIMPRAKELAATVSQPAPVSRELSKSALDNYYVQPGDLIFVEIVDTDSFLRLPGDQEILPDGTIDLGQFGRLYVAGMTLEQIEEAAMQQLRAVSTEEVPQLNVRLVSAESAVYYVLGEVNAPGSYPLVGRETVLDALMNAGGLTDRASKCDLILSRPTYPESCRVVLPICYNNLVQLGDSTTNYQIKPGDRIFVGTKTFLEELKFWRPPCELCGGLQCPCPSPISTYGPEFPASSPVQEVPATELDIETGLRSARRDEVSEIPSDD